MLANEEEMQVESGSITTWQWRNFIYFVKWRYMMESKFSRLPIHIHMPAGHDFK